MSEQRQIAVANTAGPTHHDVFSRFSRWSGKVPEGSIVNFLGVVTRARFWPPYVAVADGYPKDRYVKTEFPPFDEEYFEWIDLLEAVVTAESHFTMLELGAGWGRWIANAAAALKHIGGVPHTLIAVEAEPSHFDSMTEHLANNGVDPATVRLIRAAVAPADGKVGFQVGDTQWGKPSDWYGQSIGGSGVVEAISLTTLLRPLKTVDLIDLDVQGAELDVLEAAPDALDEKVKKVHVGTHSPRNEEGLRSLFGRLGWVCARSFPSSATVGTEWGMISFQDGVQTWLNPAYSKEHLDEITILKQKLEGSRQEAARLWAQLEIVRAQGAGAPIPGTLARKFIGRAQAFRNRTAPLGTWRRRAFDFIVTKL